MIHPAMLFATTLALASPAGGGSDGHRQQVAGWDIRQLDGACTIERAGDSDGGMMVRVDRRRVTELILYFEEGDGWIETDAAYPLTLEFGSYTDRVTARGIEAASGPPYLIATLTPEDFSKGLGLSTRLVIRGEHFERVIPLDGSSAAQKSMNDCVAGMN